jgi:predicted nucleotide-binding protein
VIEASLVNKLQQRLNKGRATVYKLINEVSRDQKLPPEQAALYLAVDSGINIAKYASPQDWAMLQRSNQPTSSFVPTPSKPPTLSPRPAVTKQKSKQKPKRGKNIWVVQGRNYKINKAVESFLRSVGLTPMEFLKAAKKPSAHIGEILESAFDQAAAVVVLLTPDDLAKLSTKFLTDHDGDYERKLTPQARPNVLFEAGMAFGRNPNNVVIVEFGTLRPFTDVAGRHVVRMNNTPQKRKELIQKLRLAGCDVDDSGASWMDEGEFSL